MNRFVSCAEGEEQAVAAGEAEDAAVVRAAGAGARGRGPADQAGGGRAEQARRGRRPRHRRGHRDWRLERHPGGRRKLRKRDIYRYKTTRVGVNMSHMFTIGRCKNFLLSWPPWLRPERCTNDI